MPDPVFETITAGRDFDHPRSAIYAHWVSPETRQRWEAGPDTGMSYDAFDTRPGGTEIVRVTHEGQEVGHMVQRIVAVEEDTMLVSQIEGHFGGAVTLAMTVVVRFEDTATGSRIAATSQVAGLTGGNVREDHEKGWAWILGRFADDLATHGPVTG